MGLISKTVMVKWHSANKKYYEELGYKYTKMKDEFEVKIKDLTKGSHVFVSIKCDCCNKIMNNISWADYLRYVKSDNTYICNDCYIKNRKINLYLGQKIGKWTIIETNLRNKRNVICSKVICDCGREESIVSNSKLISGKSKQCKLCSNNVPFVNIGDIFGEWTVIETGLKYKDGMSNMALCSCSCGRTTMPIMCTSLVKGKSTKCQKCSSKRIDFNVGDKIKNWTILDTGFRVGRSWSSKVRCDCGNENTLPNRTILDNKYGRCEKCFIDKTTEEYIDELKLKNNSVKLKDGQEYKGKYTKLIHFCSSCKNEWLVEPINILQGQKHCVKCKDKVTQSYMATALQQILFKYFYNVELEFDIGFKGKGGKSSKYDIYVADLNLIIECQSGYHDSKKDFDKTKKDFAIKKGYEFMAIDSRNFSPFEACNLFIPDLTIDKFNDIVDWSDCSRRTWNIKEAQKLLDEGLSLKEISEKLNVAYNSIKNATTNKLLIKPKNYKRKRSDIDKVIQLDLNFNYIQEYRNCSETGFCRDSIQKACNGKFKNNPHESHGYLWYRKKEYLELKESLGISA